MCGSINPQMGTSHIGGWRNLLHPSDRKKFESKTHRAGILWPCPEKPEWRCAVGGRVDRFRLKNRNPPVVAEPAKVVHLGDVAIWPLGWIASLRHPETSRIILVCAWIGLELRTKDTLLGRLYACLCQEIGARLLGRSRPDCQ